MLRSRENTVELHLCLTVQSPDDAYPCDRQAVPCLYSVHLCHRLRVWN